MRSGATASFLAAAYASMQQPSSSGQRSVRRGPSGGCGATADDRSAAERNRGPATRASDAGKSGESLLPACRRLPATYGASDRDTRTHAQRCVIMAKQQPDGSGWTECCLFRRSLPRRAGTGQAAFFLATTSMRRRERKCGVAVSHTSDSRSRSSDPADCRRWQLRALCLSHLPPHHPGAQPDIRHELELDGGHVSGPELFARATRDDPAM